MKKLAFFVVFALVALVASAQTQINWSVKAGLGFSGFMGDGSDGTNAKFGYKVGVGADVPIDGTWSFQTGLNLVSKGVKYDSNGVDVTVNQMYFELPLMAAVHLGTANNFDVVLNAGPYLAYGIGGKTKAKYSGIELSYDTFGTTSVDGETIEGFRRFDAGLGLGVAFDFTRWVIGLDTQLGLVKLEEGDAPKNISFFVTAGFKF
ncbi:porin family protein [Phocaeicola sp.]